MTPIIREAFHHEEELLTDIAMTSKAYWGYSKAFMEACRAELTVTTEKLESNSFDYQVAQLDGEIIGFYALEHLTAEETELEALFVLPEAIGIGIGKSLMQHALERATQKGYIQMHIQSDPYADDFYAAMGAEFMGSKESLSIPGRFLSMYKYSLNAN